MSESDSVPRGNHDAVPPGPNTAQHDANMPLNVGTAIKDRKVALLDAAECGDLRRVRSLLDKPGGEDKNAYVTAMDWDRRTPLHHAVFMTAYPTSENAARPPGDLSIRLLETVGLLIEHATDKNQYVTMQDYRGCTALHIAAMGNGRPEIIDRLINAATDKNQYVTLQDDRGFTALHSAAIGGDRLVVERLINEATDKNQYVTMEARNGQTALHLAAAKGNFEVVTRLINEVMGKDAYMNAQGYFLVAPRDLVAGRRTIGIADVRESENARDYVNKTDTDGNTPLHIAVINNASSVASFLLRIGANPGARNKAQNTAWDLACAPGQERWEVIAAFIGEEYKRLWGMDPDWIWWLRGNSMFEVHRMLCLIMPALYRNATNDFESSQNRNPPPGPNPESLKILASVLARVYREFHENKEALPYLRSREPVCISQTLDYPRGADRKSCEFVSIVMPYIHVEKWSKIEQREEKFDNQTRKISYCFSKDRNCLEGHMPNTLDEYCNPALPQKILASRNKDQVLGRYERPLLRKEVSAQNSSGDGREEERALLDDLWVLMGAYIRKLRHPRVSKIWKKPKRQQSRKVPTPTNVICVSQVWIWQISDKVITPEPSGIILDLPGVTWSTLARHHPSMFIALFLGRLVERFDTSQQGKKSVLRTYENGLVVLSEEVNQYTKSALIEDIDRDQETALFHQISDLREELSMIKSVLSQQEEVWNEHMSLVWPDQGPDQQPGRHPSTRYVSDTNRGTKLREMEKDVIPSQLRRTRAKFNKYNRRIAKLEQDAERVERNISIKLELKQKHATMREAHSAAILSATVFGFTIVTVIFAPLSFVVALFALPIDKFNEGKNGNEKDGVYSSNYIGKWSAATELVSIAITLVAMWASLRFVGIHVWGKKGLRQYVRQKAIEARMAEKESKQRMGDTSDDYFSHDNMSADDPEQGIPSGIRHS